MPELQVVGQTVERLDSRAKVTGGAAYAADIAVDGMLHMKIVFAGRPHALIRSLDATAALALPGVVDVITAADVPVNVRGLIRRDQQVFCDRLVRCEGDQVCAVIAETAEAAEAAARLVRIAYEDLPVLSSAEEALRPGAIQLHAEWPGNVCHRIHLRQGDPDAALAAAEVVVCGEFHTPMQEHAYLEPEAGLGYIDEAGRVTVRTSGQATHDDLRQIAAALNLPEDAVRVVYGAIGGAFGGREDTSVQVALAVAAHKLRRPVKTVWSREESIRGHGKRHAITIRHTWGARRDGTLQAAKIEIISDAGAYNYTSSEVLANFLYSAVGAYRFEHAQIDGVAAYTNNVPGCAFRGFGSPQSTFAAEMMIARLGEAVGLDPITIRLRNCVRTGDKLITGSPLVGPVSLVELIEACAARAGAVREGDGWRLPTPESTTPTKRRGFGIAVGMKNSGFGWGIPEGSYARVVLHGARRIERAEVYTAAADVGQGAHSVLAQIAAETLGLPLDRVQMIVSDTATAGDAGPCSASRMTMYGGNAVRAAAAEALAKWQNEDRPASGGGRWVAPATTALLPDPDANRNFVSYAYGAQAAEIEVDIDTGAIEVIRIVAAHDPGRAINPQQVLGQLQGGLVQALGWTLTENFITHDGRIETDRLSTYLVPTIRDVTTPVEYVLLERPDDVGVFGVRGVGEISMILPAPAIAAALHDAVGVWHDRLPLTPERVAARWPEYTG
ncbi:MAG: xanthine dehydrogenase family protein molybdopterin-binding subunit [Candidatus Promineofilum sp.]|nr:xanthine dehydrogenase family protein molybdopterin-binding subunit [Promineifilum sp.]